MKSVKELIRKYRRYTLFFIQYGIEKLKGLDFSMRDLHALNDSGGRLHGYSKTYEKHFDAIMECLDISKKDNFLDVGCGKGSVLRQAVSFPFKNICGIDFDEKLVGIANKNFQKLGIVDKISCIHADACKFTDYGSYNIFYFFNPFDGTLMEKVVKKILVQSVGDITIIYHNPIYCNVIEDTGLFKKTNELFDEMKGYYTYIYKLYDTERP